MNGPLTRTLKENGRRSSDGILKLVRLGKQNWDYQLSAWAAMKPWFAEFQDDFFAGLNRNDHPSNVRTCDALFTSAI